MNDILYWTVLAAVGHSLTTSADLEYSNGRVRSKNGVQVTSREVCAYQEGRHSIHIGSPCGYLMGRELESHGNRKGQFLISRKDDGYVFISTSG